jgi:Ca2+-binding RTX toxin-like protein
MPNGAGDPQACSENAVPAPGAIMRPRRAAVITSLVLAAALVLPQAPAQAAGTVTATFDASTGVLRVTGDGEANVVTVGRNAAGLIAVNNGAVAVAGGPATVANTSTISVATGGGDDVVRIDEANGAMPKSTQFLGSGADHGTGGSGADLLSGDPGGDVLDGKLGDDGVFGGADRDFLRGGDGIDTVIGGSGDDELAWTTGDDDDVLVGDIGVDLVRVDGSGGGETIHAAPGAATDPAGTARVTGLGATVKASAETLALGGNGGSDTFVVSTGLGQPGMPHLRLLGGADSDILLGAEGDEELLGGDGTDVLHAGAGNDSLRGSTGDDVLIGATGADRVDGEAGADQVEWRAGDGDDVVTGGEGDDLLTTLTGATPDTVGVVAAPGGRVQVRSAGVFAVDTDTERVTVRGEAANDVLSVGVGIGLLTRVTLDGGAGDDRLDGDDTGNRLVGAAGNDLLFGEGGDDVLEGSVGDDQLVGNAGDDLESGGEGNDTLFGNQGNDNLDGGAGFDFLRGGAGFDVGFNGEDVVSVP